MARKSKKNWMEQAFGKNPGALHRQLGISVTRVIPAGALAKAAKKGGKLGARARLALTAKKIAAKRKKRK